MRKKKLKNRKNLKKMIVPIKIEINNFLSIESELYKFQNGVPILIRGENLTNDGQKSNGSG